MRSAFILIVLATLVLLLPNSLAQGQDAPPRPDHPGAFVIGDTFLSDNLDPAKTSALIDFRILRGMYETLVIFDDDGITAQPGAAESWDVSDDGLTYTFHLRKDAKWSDGSPVTAVDFVAAWFRALLPDTMGDYAGLHFVIAGASDFYNWRQAIREAYWEADEDVSIRQIDVDLRSARQRYAQTVGVEAVDDFTLRVTLEHPAAYFPQLVSMLTFAPLPQRRLDPQVFRFYLLGDFRLPSEDFSNPDLVICNGPYRLHRFTEDQELRLIANEHYWNADAVRLPRLIFRAYENDDALLAAYEAGEVHWVPSVWYPEHIEALLASGRKDVHVIQNAGTYYYQFNCRDEVDGQPNPFADRILRRALAHAMDRDAICEMIGWGAAPQGVFVPPGTIAGYDSPLDAVIPFDLERAAELLKEAGYPQGDGLDAFDLLVNATGSRGGANVDVAFYLKQCWEEELGIPDVQIQQPTFMVYLEESKRGNFHVRRAGWFGDYHDPTTYLDMLRADDSNNHARYESEAFEVLMQAADDEVDPEARFALLREAEAILLQDAVIVPLYRYGTVTLYDPQRVYIPTNTWSITRLDHLDWVEE